MAKLKNLTVYWLPPSVWMVIIFYFSSRHHFGITHEFTVDFLIFKTLHMIEYAILYFLLFRAIFRTTKISLTKKFLYPFVFALLYATSDEIHQTFVPTREGKIRDVFIDAAGITLVFLYIKYHLHFLKKYL